MTKLLYFLLSITLSFCLWTHPASAQNITYVTETGAGNQSGASWANAIPGSQLRSVLRTVTDSGQVWIAEGTYYPDLNARDSSFYINSGTKVYGGFTGTETSPSQRDWTAHPTILSGDIGVPNDTSDNSRHVVFLYNVGDSTIIDGITITMGNANGGYSDPPIDGLGGGVVNNPVTVQQGMGFLWGYSNPVFRNCTFLENYSFQYGGGYCELNAGATCASHFYNCIFDGNSSGRGGAYASYLMYGGEISPRFDSCRFINNIIDTSAALLNSAAGAIYLAKYQQTYATMAHINNCYFENNAARDGGVIASSEGFDFNIKNCVFKNNYAMAHAVLYSTGSSHTITGCTFDSNQAQFDVIELVTGQDQKTKSYITNCIFKGNNCFYSIENNTGIYQPGHYSNDTTFITNCLFINDGHYGTVRSMASPGGKTTTHLNNVTIHDDSSHVLQKIQVENIGMNADGLLSEGVAKMYINNCIFWYPLSIDADKAIKSHADGPPGTSGGIAITEVSHSLFRSWQGGWPAAAGQDMGGNLLNIYPGFVDSVDNFRLNCNAPAVNAGQNSLYPQTMPDMDLDGNNREVATIDMGCYELPANPVIAIQPNATVQGHQLTMNIQASFTINNLHWDLGDGTTGNSVNVAHTYQQGGDYNVCIHIETPCGGQDSCFTVNIADGEGISPVTKNAAFKVFPNPVTNRIVIAAKKASDKINFVRVTDLTGKTMFENRTNGFPKIMLSAKNWASGIYFVEVNLNGEIFQTVKVVKKE